MAIDFFESQDVARKRTGRLVLLFILAVVAIIALLYVIVAVTMGFVDQDPKSGEFNWDKLWNPYLIGMVGLGTLLVVGGGSLFKIRQLSGGGHVIAESLGGRRLNFNSTKPHERKVLNVVEEMAIASGMPTPPVFLLENESGINAFAAGFSPNDAVIGVTRGCVEQLSRDELQGVIAHEFSHILNGDMRINIRLIGVIHGILVIGLIGFFVLRSAAFSGGASRRSSRQGGGGGVMAILALGAGLAAIGFLGTFFGNLIKAAVSRQREFLADASAVQFTRNPEGISGALKRIGGLTSGSKIKSPNAPETSHMFFGQGVSFAFGALYATHPPLPQRILRLDPGWDGKFLKARKVAKAVAAAMKVPKRKAPLGTVPLAAVAGLAGGQPAGGGAPSAPRTARAVDQIGNPSAEHLAYAARIIQSIPEPITEAVHEPYGARAVIYAMLINRDQSARDKQLAQLRSHADAGVYDTTLKLLPAIERLAPNARIPLVDMATPALRSLTRDQYDAFKKNVLVLIKADKKIEMFEWTLQHILLRHVECEFTKVKPPRVKRYALTRMQHQCELLLSTLAYVGQREETAVRHAFDQGAAELELSQLALKPLDQCSLSALDQVLDDLAEVAPRLKRKLITACAVCVSADREVTLKEAELLRAVADALACPMPPLLPGQSLV